MMEPTELLKESTEELQIILDDVIDEFGVQWSKVFTDFQWAFKDHISQVEESDIYISETGREKRIIAMWLARNDLVRWYEIRRQHKQHKQQDKDGANEGTNIDTK